MFNLKNKNLPYNTQAFIRGVSRSILGPRVWIIVYFFNILCKVFWKEKPLVFWCLVPQIAAKQLKFSISIDQSTVRQGLVINGLIGKAAVKKPFLNKKKEKRNWVESNILALSHAKGNADQWPQTDS